MVFTVSRVSCGNVFEKSLFGSSLLGRTHLNAQETEVVVVIPACIELLAFDASPFGGFPFDHVEGKSSESGQVFGSEA